jgi:hypothetical protein
MESIERSKVETEIKQVEAMIRRTDAETEKLKAETRRTDAQTECIMMDTDLKKKTNPKM